MHAPPAGMDPRHVQELHNRFSKLSADLSACLDAVLLELERAPENPRAVRLARDLASAQYAVTQQLMRLPGMAGHSISPALPPSQTYQAHPLLPAPASAAQPAAAPWPDAAAALQAAFAPPAAAPTAGSFAMPEGGAELSQSLSELLQQRKDTATPAHGAARFHNTMQVHYPAATPAPYQTPLPYAGTPGPAYGARVAPVVELSPASLPNSHEMIWTTAAQSAPALAAAESVAPQAVAPTSPPAPRKSGRDKVELPLWMASAPGWTARYSPARAAAVLFSMLALLIIALNAGQRTQKPSADAAEAPSVEEAAAPGRKLPGQVPAVATASLQAPAAEAADVNTTASITQEPPHPAISSEPAPDANSAQVQGTASVERDALPAATPSYAGALTSSDTAAKPGRAALPKAVTAAPAVAAPVARRPAPQTSSIEEPGFSSDTEAAAKVRQAEAAPPSKKPAAKPAAEEKAATGAAPAPKVSAQGSNGQIAPFKTAVVKADTKTKGQFAPLLLQLKSSESLLRMFQDLQQRYPAALANKRAELRPVTGPDNEKWMALLAVPAMSREQAEAVCRDMGAEGQALGCSVTGY